MKTVYCLKLREDDSKEWGATEYFKNRKARDHAASLCRIISGMRTWSFEEKKPRAELEALFSLS